MNVTIDNRGKKSVEDLLAILKVDFINHMSIYWKDAVKTKFEIVKKKIEVQIPGIYDGIALTITLDPEQIHFSAVSGNHQTELEKLRSALIDFLSIPVVVAQPTALLESEIVTE